jgi:hypothetical protein
MVQASASLLISDLATTSTGARLWKYRANVKSCSSLSDRKDRHEDITHARHAVGFLAMLHIQKPSAYGVSEALVEGVLQTFLEGLVHPQSNPTQYFDGRRFACDLGGTTDVDASGQIIAPYQLSRAQKKSCRAARSAGSRVTYATYWSYLAAALSNPSQRCKSIDVVAAVFPMLLAGSPHFGKGFSTAAGKEAVLAAAALHAKYWFYNYNLGSSCCDGQTASAVPPSAVAAPAVPGACKDKKDTKKCEKKQQKGKCSNGQRKDRVRSKCAKTCGAC